MTALATLNPIPQYFDLAGHPLSNGSLYFGAVNQDAETSPIAVYWDADGTQPAAQPIHTLNGYPARSGTPAVVFADRNYSLTIKDKRGVVVFTARNSATFSNADLLEDQLTAITTNLADTSDAGKGAGLIGYRPDLVYAANTVGFKLKEVTSICDAPYNCRPDGNIAAGSGTDWTAKINQAIADLGTTGCLFVPPGIFKCAGQITLPTPGFTLYGAGMYCSILFTPNAFSSDGLLKTNGVGGAPTNIRSLGILAQNGGAGATSIGINSQANGTLITDCWIAGFKTNVVLGSSDNFFMNSITEEAISGGGGLSITSPSVTVANISVYNCYIGVNIGPFGFVNSPAVLTNVRTNECGYAGFNITGANHVQLSACSAGNLTNAKFGAAAVRIDGSSNISIDGFAGKLGTISTSGYGIDITASSEIAITGGYIKGWIDGVRSQGTSGLSITGTQSTGNGRRGFYIAAGDRVNLNGVIAINNGYVGSADAGIYLENSASSSVFNITGAICSQSSGGPQDYGIYANLTDNGVSTGYINITGSTCTYNGTADIAKVGAIGNIKVGTDCIAPVISGGLPTVASTASLTLPVSSDTVLISGTTNITSITAGNPGRVVRLIFTGALTLTDNANLILNSNFTTTTSDVLTLVSDGAVWYEISRSAN